MTTPLVAIIGLPNSGKSTFFNKVLERRAALTHNMAGTTRDRAYGLTNWNGLGFYLIDTAGIINRPDSQLEKNIQKQTAIALDEADLIIFMVDGRTNVSEQDLDVASKLRRSKKDIVLAVNKVDFRNQKSESAAGAYKKLGLKEPFLVSSINGSGIGDLLDQVVKLLKARFGGEADLYKDHTRVAFIGKPNVGKSSLINAVLKEERLLVDAKAGTTRSTVEIPFVYKKNKFLLLDTAGIKKKWKQEVDIEAAAMMQSIKTIAQIDVAFFVVDGSERITAQDQIIAQKILEEEKPLVILLNKMDLMDNEKKQRLLDILPDYFPQLWWAPVVFTSAKTGEGLDLILKFAVEAQNKSLEEVDGELLDAFLDEILKQHMPGKMDDQRAPKIYNLKQIGTRPPMFKLTVNFPAAIATAWRRFFEKQFRLKFGFEATPVVIKYLKRE